MLNSTVNQDLKKKILKFCEPNVVFGKIPKEYLHEYYQLLEIPAVKSILSDAELVHTISMFFENNLNISVTSKNAFMHRNTLIYRIEKIKREIGLNIKNFEEARIMRNMMLIKQVLEEENKG